MNREDLSRFLIHWISGKMPEEAFELLHEIIDTKTLKGNHKYIMGKFRCICFTETPPKYFNFSTCRYQPFGLMYLKEYICESKVERVKKVFPVS